MRWVLKGNLFLKQMEKAYFLFEKGISIIVDNEEILCTSMKDYIKSLLLLQKNNYIDKKEFDDGLKDVYKYIYDRKILQQIKEETYRYNADKNNIIMYCKGKYLLLKKVYEGNLPHYYIAAKDANTDNDMLKTREIPFLIKKDSPMYSCFENYCTSDEEKLSLVNNSENINHLKLYKDEEDNYILSIQKVKSDQLISDNKQAIVDMGTCYSNKKYMMIDSIFESVSAFCDTQKTTNPKCQKKI